MEMLWTILYCIFMLSGILVHFSTTHNWSIKSKIFLLVIDLCLCSVLVVVGFCSDQGLITNIACMCAILVLFKVLKNLLDRLEKESAEKALEAQKKNHHTQKIIDAEGYTICD